MNHNRDYLVRVLFNDSVKAAGDPCVKLCIALAAGNFPPLLLLAHFDNFGVILVGLYSKQSSLPLTQMNFPQVLHHSGYHALACAQWSSRFMRSAQVSHVYRINDMIGQALT